MILDASVAVPLLIDHELSVSARRLADDYTFISPNIMFAETANALWKYSMRDDLPVSQIQASVTELRVIAIGVPDDQLLDAAIDLAVTHRHPVYDCLYLALALQRREPLATADKKLAALAGKLGIPIELIEPSL